VMACIFNQEAGRVAKHLVIIYYEELHKSFSAEG
jgi:hypothetical protein